MVKHIQLLTEDTIDKIAAGEVVEKPASVVKELVENAIDAGADAITVEIMNGGLDSIRITDNGCGIPKDEIALAFLRHSTSKISDITDLSCIKTLGFRGEALSSIAAVSKVEVISKTQDDTLGMRYVIEGAKEIEKEAIGAPDGTTFFVRSLFYNTPARKKFLKSEKAEGNAVYSVMEHLALSNPNISFSFFMNHKMKFSTVGNGELLDIIYQLYGKDIAKALIPIDYIGENINIYGFIGDSSIVRGNRLFENFYVNGRYVKSKILSDATEEAYIGKVMQHQYPFVCIFIDFLNDGVDVNVHPTKMEVRFYDNDFVFYALKSVIYSALNSREDIHEVVMEPVSDDSKPVIPEIIHAEPFESNLKKEIKEKLTESIAVDLDISPKTDTVKPEPVNYVQQDFLTKESVKMHRIIGEVFDTFWLVEFDGKLYIIDQHAAHEKVLFEKTMKSIKDKTMTSQMISPGIVISLSTAEENILEEYLEEFTQIGYGIEFFGGHEYCINAVPGNVFSVDYKSLFFDLLNNCMDLKGTKSDLVLERVASMSCKAAVKANDHLSYNEAKALIDELLECENPFHCPHGRPTIISMTKYELEKKFKRIV